MMSIFEASEYMSLSSSTVRRLARDKEIPAGKVGRQWRFHKDDLDQFLTQQYEPKGDSHAESNQPS